MNVKKRQSPTEREMLKAPVTVLMRLFFTGLYITCAVVSIVFLAKAVAVRQQIQKEDRLIEQAVEEGNALQEQIARADSPEAIEDNARRIGLGYADETIFIDRNSINSGNTGD